MQAQKEYPPDLGNCRDKFLLQSTVAPSGDEVTSEMFDKSKNKVCGSLPYGSDSNMTCSSWPVVCVPSTSMP